MINQQKFKKAGLISAFLFVLIFCVIRALKGSDFDIYLLASQALVKNNNIYDPALTDNVQYFYSPFFALILVPFSLIPFFISKFFWLLLSTFFWYRINQIVITELKNQNVMTNGNWPILLSNLVLIGFLIDNYHMIQVTFLILWGTLESLRLIFANKTFSGSILLGILINIKLLPLPFIPYLIYRRKFKAAIISSICVVVLLFIPALFLGWDYNLYLHKHWWSTINPSSQGHLLETNILVFNIQALLSNLLTDNNGIPLTSLQNIKYLIFFVIILIAATTIIFLKTRPFTPAKNRLQILWEISYVLLATVLIFPHQNKYATVYIFPAVLYIFNYISLETGEGGLRKILSSTGLTVLTVTVLLSIFLISLTGKDLVGKQLYLFFADIKSITIGELLLIPVLAYLMPERVCSRIYKGSQHTEMTK